jgi:quinol monooxygenase YgiN
MSEVVVMAVFKAKEGREREVSEALSEVAAQTHEEEGCLLYALHSSPHEEGRFGLIERWTDQEALNEHLAKPYIQALGERAGDVLAEPPQVYFLDPLAAGDPAKGALGA